MPDVTDKILAENTPDPRCNPLLPTVGKLKDYAHNVRSEIASLMKEKWEEEYYPEMELENYHGDLESEGDHITYEWATNEILGHQMNWVRVGLVAERVRRYKLYQHKFSSFQTYCMNVLGRKEWQIRQTIKAALTTMELIRYGFPILPKCISHAIELEKCCKKTGKTLVDAWELVIEELPLAHLITSSGISEILGFPSQKKKITLPTELYDRLADAASNDGVTVNEKLTQFLDSEEPEPETAETTEDEELDQEDQLWYQDMKQMVKEHDHQLWFLSAISKMAQPLRKSRYSWLKQLRNQT